MLSPDTGVLVAKSPGRADVVLDMVDVVLDTVDVVLGWTDVVLSLVSEVSTFCT